MLPTVCFATKNDTDGCHSRRSERAFDDVSQIAGKAWCLFDPPKGGFCLRPAAAFEHAPAAKGSGKPCRNLRIFRVEGENGFGDEIVAETVRPTELCRVALRECADQRTDTIWIGERERRMRGETANIFKRIRLRDDGLQGKPLVHHENVRRITSIEIGK